MSSQQPAGLTIEQRRAILQKEINGYVTNGWRVATQTDTTAQLIKPKHINWVWVILWLVLALVGLGLILLLIYFIMYWAKHDETAYLEVDEKGKLRRR